MGSKARPAAFLIAVLAAAWLRILPGNLLWTSGRLELPGDTDGYEHARRVELTLGRFPWTPQFDSFSDAPAGAVAYWSPLFDLSAAAAARAIWGDKPTEGQLERLYIWSPLVAGSLTAGGLAWALWPLSPPAAMTAAAAAAVLPAHRAYSLAARFDHHVAEALLFALWLAAMLRFARLKEEGRSRLGISLGLGLIHASLAAIWGGGLLLWAALSAALAVESWFDGWAAASLGVSAAAFQAFGLWCGTAAGRQPLSFYEAWPLVACCGWLAAAGASALVWARSARDRGAPLGALAGIAAVWAAAAAWPAAQATSYVMTFFGTGTVRPEWRFYATAGESFPLWRDPSTGFTMLGPGFFAAPLLAWLTWRLDWPAGFRRQAIASALAAWALALLKARYMYLAAIGLAVLEGGAAAWLWEHWNASAPKRAAALISIFLALHAIEFRSAASAMGADEAKAAGLEEAFGWLRAKTPEAGDFDDPLKLPSYSIFCDWNVGHPLKYRARRPVVADANGHGTVYEAEALAAPDEASLNKVLDRRKVRYLFLTPISYKTGTPLERLFWNHGSGLSTFKEVFESRQLRETPGRAPTAPVKIFERVPGEILKGRAKKDATVRISLELSVGGQRRWTYEAETKADAGGLWRVRVPYSDAGGEGLVTAAGKYSIAR